MIASPGLKPVGAAALIFNRNGQLLIVRPCYKPGWSLPGGTVERGESPKDGCAREISEELGLNMRPGNLLCLDYQVSPDGESLQFLFLGGVLSDEEAASITLARDELQEFCFETLTQSKLLLSKRLGARLPFALGAIKSGHAIYLENGRPISSGSHRATISEEFIVPDAA